MALSALNTIGMLTENGLWYDPSRYSVGLSFFWWGGVLIFSIMAGTFYLLDQTKENDPKTNKFERVVEGIDWKYITIIFILAWLPYCILHYPTWLGGGASNQIYMFYGEETRARNMSEIIYEGHYLSNHHPILLTLYYGFFWELGEAIGNVNAGVFIMSCTNLVICATALSFMMKRLKKYLSSRAYTVMLAYMCFYPFFGTYAFSFCKDNLYVAALAVFYTLLSDMVLSDREMSKTDTAGLFAISILIPFLKSQGIIIVSLSLLMVSLMNRLNRKKLLLTVLVSFFLFSVIFSRVLMPTLKISPVGRQEALAIPFQQTALLFKDHPESISKEEYDAVNAILPADELAELYNRELADEVKFEFNQKATAQEIREYLRVWFKGFFKHPLVYIRAWAGLTDGYYYMAYDWANTDLYHELDVHGAYWPEWVSTFHLETEDPIFEKIYAMPVLGQSLKCCIFCWISIFSMAYLIYSRQCRRVLLMATIVLNYLVLFLCPGNAFVRYTLPLIWMLPIEYAIVSSREPYGI